MTDVAPETAAPSVPSEIGRVNLLAVVAIALAFLAPVGGVVVGIIARRDVRRTGERGDGIAFAAILIGAVLTVATVLVPAAIAVSSYLGLGMGLQL